MYPGVRLAVTAASLLIFCICLTESDSSTAHTLKRIVWDRDGAMTPSVLSAKWGNTAQIPDWCKPFPRAEYKSLERMKTTDPWFEVYKVAPNTLAIYEPHQSE